MPKILIHIVTFNSASVIEACLRSIPEDLNITVLVTDNSSSDKTTSVVERYKAQSARERIELNINPYNLGFAAAHNQGFFKAKEVGADFVLVLNPDVILTPTFLEEFLKVADRHPEAFKFTPKLLRTDEKLSPLNPPIIDAAGMILDNSARHFDRGSDEEDVGQFEVEESVFGGTGAALLFRVKGIERLCVKGEKFDADKGQIYPQLLEREFARLPVFDEAFFAYREDAELAWRARNIGVKTIYCPKAVAYHRRLVTPERRQDLPSEINSWSVRNRFLMQIVNFRFGRDSSMLWHGIVLRNLVVILGVLLREWPSLPGLWQVLTLWRRAWERRKMLMKTEQIKVYAQRIFQP